MRRDLFARLLVVLMASTPAAGTPDPVPSNGRSRVVLVIASRPDEPALLQQRALLAGAEPALLERDVIVQEVTGSDAAGLARHYGVGSSFGVVLIGKDGGVKLRSGVPIAAGRLEEVIDAMPMRQSEAAARR